MAEKLAEFIASRQAGWDELGVLVRQARGKVHNLNSTQVRALGSGYRSLAADLAVARRRYMGDPVTLRLEALAHDARPLLYGSVTERASVGHYVTTGYWRRVAERPVFLVISALFLFGPMFGVALWSHANPDQAGQVAQVSDLTAGIGQGDVRDPDAEKITDIGQNAGFSGAISANNARIALIAFAGGLTGGVMTLASLLFNGLVIGLVFGLGTQSGNGEALLRLIAPHGVLELSLIVVSGAAGLRTGWALLRPGHRTRIEALASEGRAGVEMALGSAVLLFPSGLIEGFVTPRGLSLPTALVFGVGAGSLYWALVWWRGRQPRRGSTSTGN